jgi:hypothetical protein
MTSPKSDIPDTSDTAKQEETARLAVVVSKRGDGSIRSAVHPLSAQDREVFMGWETGGMQQTCMALLVEAVRREALLAILVRLSRNQTVDMLDAAELDAAVRAQVMETLTRVSRPLVEDTLAGVRKSSSDSGRVA